MLGYVQSKVLHTVTFSVLQLQRKRAQRSIRLLETNKTLSLDFLLGLRGRVHSEVKFDVRLRAIKRYRKSDFLGMRVNLEGSRIFNKTDRDEQNPVFRFFASPKGKGTL